jgi:hypothetical protein
MSNKQTINKTRLGKLGAIIVILLMGFKFAQSTGTKFNLNAWEDVHQWRTEGECADCHSEHEYVEKAVDFSTTLPIPAAKTHTEQFRRFTHGKDGKFASHSCQPCHEADACQSCHARLPESHTTDFIEPTGNTAGSLRHSMLAKTNPTSCLTCHRSFVQSCTGCHATDEVMPWQKDAAVTLSRWSNLLN